MSLTLVKGNAHPYTMPHPKMYRYKIARLSDGFVQMISCICHEDDVPAGWSVVVKEAV